MSHDFHAPKYVALRKESVDRNCCHPACCVVLLSLSARRAWIEIGSLLVAPVLAVGSLSARRAWIEMVDYVIDYVNDAVALRKESVDRNSCWLLA